MVASERSEYKFRRALEEALLTSNEVKRIASSREHSLAITNLEQSLLWCGADIAKKFPNEERAAS